MAIPQQRCENEKMSHEYDDVELPFEREPEESFCAECQGPLPRIAVRSLNRPQRYCCQACCRLGYRRIDRWRALQGSTE
uniref:Uncharacterized protein n=1 Tax=uncultured prokaryote TaxID=198431 RepID=A0A0H5QNB4_9ZZZZ|nr:hypothetical protein [uncultured prokaryote]